MFSCLESLELLVVGLVFQGCMRLRVLGMRLGVLKVKVKFGGKEF